ncbi:WD40-repeat-containing domain protein [Phascolomyces articulosus]|uniref:WD40-repeat-containing domain protein n=1 Tax=Phascolomyces articulosus TaxID=60185 RepID=A0AAD5JZA1_9FUNG|nr:WD40-repeat-containing domain protein [Phascolomyces articulosus]
MQDQSSSQFEITDPPTDGITNVIFSPTDSRLLLASSWDSTVRLYNVDENRLQTQVKHHGAILDTCFGIDSNTAYHGGLEKQVTKLDLETSTEQQIGTHDAPVRCVRWSSETIAMASRQIYVYDIRNMAEPWQTRETSLRYMLKSLRCMPNGEGYACSSIEGRVALEFFDMSPETQARKYAFKSHRHTINDTEVVYPVNALAFHPIYGTFASGGSDCVVSIWDGVNRKRIRQFPRYPDEISSLAFSHDGMKLAVASSYTFDEGERDHAPDGIFIKTLGENDCKPRTLQNNLGNGSANGTHS